MSMASVSSVVEAKKDVFVEEAGGKIDDMPEGLNGEGSIATSFIFACA